MTKQITEQLFSEWCKRKNYYRLKLQVNLASKDIFGSVISQAMPSDYLVLKKDKICFVEIKEVLSANAFPNNRFRQQYKLTKLANYDCKVHECFVLIHFVKYKLIVVFEINEYNKLISGLSKKSIAIKDIPEANKFGWKTLCL